MNQHLQTILNIIQQSQHLSDEEKAALSKAAKDAAKELDITAFKLDRTEKVKRTTAILLEETIAELENKRKAVEEQNRELEIETSLERVRTIAMSMNKPDDMLDVCKTISQQLELLNVKEIRNVQTAIFYESKGTYMNYEYYAKHDKTFITETIYTDNKIHQAFAGKMLKGNGEFYITHINGDEVKEWIAYQKTTNVFIDDYLSTASSLNYYWFSLGAVALGISTYEPLKDEDINLFKRFLKVFELAYRRYLDIERAEAQAREARIETALERVRAVAMAMKQSEELITVCEVMYKELLSLGFTNIRNAQIAIEDDQRQSYFFYVYSDFEKITAGETGYNSSPIVQRLYKELGKSGDGLYEREYSPAEMEEWRNWRKSLSPLLDAREETAASLCWYMYAIGKGNIGISTFNSITKEQVEIVKRFKKVFELSYRRFDDLQKAEAQAREAQIEAALERVRSRSLAMYKSDEIIEVAKSVFEKLDDLSIELNTIFIIIFKEGSRDSEWWLVNRNDKQYASIFVKYADVLVLREQFEAKEQGKELFSATYYSKEIKEFFRYLFTQTDFKYAPPARQKIILESEAISISMAMKNKIAIQVTRHTGKAFSNEENEIVKRFAKVFDQSYTRFLDLQKAEVQAREATIEAALERVRTKTLAMKSSQDIADAVASIFDELLKLGVGSSVRCGISIFYDDKDLEIWTATTDAEGKPSLVIGKLDPNIHSLLKDTFIAWRNKETEITKILSGDELRSFYTALNNAPNYPFHFDIEQLPEKRINNTFFFPEGALYAYTDEVLPEEAKQLFKRFANAFSLTYRRFFDLQKAEAQAREAQVEAALERVRSRTLAMQKSDELAETAAVLFQQLIHLGIEPHRLYISILKDDEGNSEFWITDEDGSKISMAYETNLKDNASFKKMYSEWQQQKKSLVVDMKGKELKEYFKYLTSINVPFKGGLAQKRRWQYIAYFSKGFIGMASPDEQPAETLQLLERFAYVFNLTFTRFNDLQIAEAHAVQAEQDLIEIKAARKKAEDTLSELQVTQRQLIQSEKMASLGELTAGIAHEIQNPLNFVNNFSEVSKELLDEMKAELETGNMQSATEIANDIIQNLEKINHHGKRADAIVKGMLQHSRKSSGQKEPTDINALCDEYLRLSYHGLRAKDKSFNTDFKTDFDESIGKINIVPQDVARVLLNLINNAFYAVNEKRKLSDNSYQPIAGVQTRKINNRVEIIVSDNGNGIPQNIIDKIFQPFFTTKPTGQGTGLGLSLAYDIITKEHEGTIKAVSKENEGTTFIINLPVT